MTIYVKIDKTTLMVEGKYSNGESEVGLSSSFQIKKITSNDDLSNLIEWAGSRQGHALEEIEQLCLRQIN